MREREVEDKLALARNSATQRRTGALCDCGRQNVAYHCKYQMCGDVLTAPLYCTQCAEEGEIYKHRHFSAKAEVLAQVSKYRNRNLEKIKDQVRNSTDFDVIPQLIDSSEYSACSVDTKGRRK